MVPNKEDEGQKLGKISEIDRIVHEPSRYLIMSYLAVVESADFTFILNQTGLTRGNLSSHLTKLELAGYVEINKEFIYKVPRTLIRINKKGKEAFKTYCAKMRSILENIPEEK